MNTARLKFIVIGLLFIGMLGIACFSYAEMQIEVQEDQISADVSPSNPQPYQNVTITISSYATDLNKAIITWSNGSGTVLSGIGKTSYSFKAGAPDSVTIFDVNIIPVGAMTNINKRITIIPSEIELVWQSVNGNRPPFYRGKILPINGSYIKVVAIPNTSKIRSGNGSLSYTWKNNDNTVLEASGYNKNYYIFKHNPLDEKLNIEVVASTVDGKYGAENSISIPLFKPKLVFYKKSLAEGIMYNNALNEQTILNENEMTIIAEPYFFPVKGNSTTYAWKINGNNIETPSKKTELTIKPTSRGGYATIGLTIENLSEVFQKISSQLKINL